MINTQRQQAQRQQNQIPQQNPQQQTRPNGGQPGVARPNGAPMQPNQNPMVSTNQPVTSHMSMNSQGQGPPISMHVSHDKTIKIRSYFDF